MKKTIALLVTGALLSVSLDACEKSEVAAPYQQAGKTTCVVDFDRGDGTVVNQQHVAMGSWLVRPPDPTREGYTFAGWTKDLARQNPWIFAEDTVPCSMVLYAKWVKN